MSCGRLGVEGPGRLVGQDEVRVADQGPGNGHPLLLSARQFAGPVLHPVSEAHPLERAMARSRRSARPTPA